MSTRFSDLKKVIGFDPESKQNLVPGREWIETINLNLWTLGEPIFGSVDDFPSLRLGQNLLEHYRAKDQLRDDLRAPVDRRIEDFLRRYLKGIEGAENIELPEIGRAHV